MAIAIIGDSNDSVLVLRTVRKGDVFAPIKQQTTAPRRAIVGGELRSEVIATSLFEMAFREEAFQ